MPELAEDIATRVAQNGVRLVPAEGQTGYYLGVTGQSPFRYAFLQPPDDEIPRFAGSPDGELSAPIDSLVRNTDDHTVWINTDGDTAWELVGSGGDVLVFAKQMYGTANDPGGGAPTNPWESIVAADNDRGGIFTKDIDDPSIEEGGWISVNFQDLRSGLSFGVDPDTTWGFMRMLLRHFGGTNVEAKHQLYAQTDTAADGTADVTSVAVSPTPRATTEWQASADDGDLAQVVVDCEINAYSPQVLLRQVVSAQEAIAALMVGFGDPNGSILAAKGSILMDTDTPALWQNQDGATTWTAF